MAENENLTAAEEPQGSTEEPKGAQTEPQGTDWKAEARKWEARAKENKKKAERLDEIEEANKTELQKAQDAATAAQKEAKEAKAELERLGMVAKVAKETGIPSELLHGATEEELKESAEAIKGYIASQKPSIPTDQGGSAGTPSATIESIEKIEDPIARVRARAANAQLYQN